MGRKETPMGRMKSPRANNVTLKISINENFFLTFEEFQKLF